MKPVVEFVTAIDEVARAHPPVRGPKAMPEWYRRMPVTDGPPEEAHLRLSDHLTMRACPGVHDWFSWGWTVPMWADMRLRGGEDHFDGYGSWGASTPNGFGESKCPGFPFAADTTRYLLKFNSPWTVRTPPGWSIAILPLDYQRDGRFRTLPGLIETDGFHQLNVIVEWLLPPGADTILKAGTPVCQVVPFRREDPAVEIKVDAALHEVLAHRGTGGMGGGRLVAGAYRELVQRAERKSPRLRRLVDAWRSEG